MDTCQIHAENKTHPFRRPRGTATPTRDSSERRPAPVRHAPNTTTFERAISGDRLATEWVIESLRPRISRMAAYYARCSGEDADDLLQEAWVGLLESLPDLDVRIGSPEQHLIQRARWRLLDAIRRSHLRRCSPIEEEDLERIPEPGSDDASGIACANEFTRQLNSTQRMLLQCLLNGLTWREAARVLGCTSANVAYHVRQIRARYESWSR